MRLPGFGVRTLYAFVLVLGAGFGAQTLADDDARARIEALNAAWNDAFNSGDAAAVAALYHQNAHLSPGNQQVLTGRDAIQALFQSFIDAGVHEHAIEIVDVHASGDIAYEIAKWSAKGAEQDGQKPAFGGVLLNIFERQSDGSWQSRLHIWN